MSRMHATNSWRCHGGVKAGKNVVGNYPHNIKDIDKPFKEELAGTERNHQTCSNFFNFHRLQLGSNWVLFLTSYPQNRDPAPKGPEGT